MLTSDRSRSGESVSRVDTGAHHEPAKPAFNIDAAMDAIREGMRSFRTAALFELCDDGFKSQFEQLLACTVSIRTRDGDTGPISRRLFDRARVPAEVAALSVGEIDALIAPSTFHGAKALRIHEIARRTVTDHGGALPPRYWGEIKALRVSFGKPICTGNAPRCSRGPVLSMCAQFRQTGRR